MPKARQLSLCLLGALSIIALLASSASAKITFQWKVNGSILKAGESRTFIGSQDGVADLSGSVAGTTILLLSTKGSVEPGARIIGGQPGKSEGTSVLENVVVDRPAACTVESLPNPEVGVIRTSPLLSEIVEGENGEVLILVKPKEGNTFTSLRFLNKTGETCPLNLQEANVTGGYLALPLPQLTEVLRGVGDGEAAEKNFFLSNGQLDTAGLSFGGNAVHLTGLALGLLTSDEKAGVF